MYAKQHKAAEKDGRVFLTTHDHDMALLLCHRHADKMSAAEQEACRLVAGQAAASLTVSRKTYDLFTVAASRIGVL